VRRSVPDVIPDGLLLPGCFAGLGMFLVGHRLGVHLAAVP
jgi:hypothetical protein